ncbi:PKD domain-containing protein [Nocardioides solisilvae]|uniref:PKD domain-containing protein n=1 Tax=Nocardioides solisilvae TaxID=1542435 RepID=UPI0013A52DA3|nr:PKD domain-containing protein [Nocardioides solisilvae]
MSSRFKRALALVAVVSTAALGGQLPATGVVQPGGQLVGEVAASRTPHVLDGMVYSAVETAGRVVLGGDFSKARNDGTSTELPRNNLLAFDPVTGAISTTFLPQPNGVVRVVLPAADGESVYVGGKFSSIGGKARKNLALVRVSDGAVLPFDAGNISGQVRDLRLAGGRLWVAGQFTHVQGHDQAALATVDPRSGAFLPHMRRKIAGIHNSGTTNVLKIDVTPAGDRLVAVGNFDTLDGVVRHQLLQLDISGEEARETPFNTRFFTASCWSVFDTYMRDVDYSPDGSFFVVTTTGGYGGADAPCDSVSRFETYASGATVQPSWLTQTGGDTLYAVEVTDSVVYIGGHFRWLNNSFGNNRVAAGAVERQGVAAVDPDNGLPYTWNPGKDRGIGVFDFLVGSNGLWIASDTERIGDGQLKQRIARMPLDGVTFPAVRSAQLPNDVYTVGSTTTTARSLRGVTVGAARSVSGLTASSVKGAFMVNGWLYVAQSDGTFVRRTFDGTRFGPAERVNTSDLLATDTAWRDDMRYATGMFYDNGRIYFTRSGTNELRYRYFTPQSGVVGARRMVASGNVNGISFSGVRGMFLADGRLYWADSQGTLRSIAWAEKGPSGGPVANTATVVSGPNQDRVSWVARDMFLFQDAQGRGAAMEPQASFDVRCTSLTCDFDGTTSIAPGGDVASYAWDFGDGATATGPRPSRTYASNGRRTVRLTVTDDRGQTSTTTREVSVTRVNQAPTASFTASCQGTTCAFDASASDDSDGPLASYAWDFGDGTTGTGVRATKTYPAEGTRRVTLTVTDGDGVRASTSQDVAATLARVVFGAAASSNSNAAAHRVTLPGGVAGGDLLVLHLGLNSEVAISDPAGWTRLADVANGGVAGRSWWRYAADGDAGTNVRVDLGATAKGDLSVAAYRGTGGLRAYVADHAAKVHTSRSTSFRSPLVTVPQDGGWLGTYWALKSPDEASWATLAGQTARSTSSGIGSGRITATVSDSAGSVSPGPAGDLVGTTTVEVPRAIVFSTAIGLR